MLDATEVWTLTKVGVHELLNLKLSKQNISG